MKNIFLLLLAANAALGLWLYIKPADQPRAKSTPSADLTKAVPSLSLLAELPEAQLAELQDKRAAEQQQQLLSSAKPIRPICQMIGPFAVLLKAEYAAENLKALDVRADVQVVDLPGDPGFWVFLKPLPSRKQAMRLLRQLQAKGVDSYVFKKGELRNGISFGLYSHRSSALRRQQEVVQMGYQPGILEQARSKQEVWVVVSGAEAAKLDRQAWQQFASERKGIEIKENYCPGVASSENLL